MFDLYRKGQFIRKISAQEIQDFLITEIEPGNEIYLELKTTSGITLKKYVNHPDIVRSIHTHQESPFTLNSEVIKDGREILKFSFKFENNQVSSNILM